MSNPTQWTQQQQIDNLANQMAAERKARARESVTAIWLRREGENVVVLFEREGRWFEAIREQIDDEFSHIIEASGMRVAFPDTLTTDQAKDLAKEIEEF